MNNYNKQIANYYDSCDKSYQHWGESEVYSLHYGYWEDDTKSHLDSLVNMNRVVSRVAKIKNGDKVLDAGCGVGASSIWLASEFANSPITGITLSEQQCKRAGIFALKNNVADRVKFYVKDFHSTDFDEATFDVSWSIESFCHSDHKAQFLMEISRILKRDGRMVVADYFLTKPYSELNKLQKWALNGWLRGWCMSCFLTVKEFKEWCEAAGFTRVREKDISKQTSRSAKEIFKRGYRGYLFDRYVKKRSLIEMNHVKGCVFQYLALIMGVWKYQILLGEK